MKGNAKMNDFTQREYTPWPSMGYSMRKESDDFCQYWSGTVTHKQTISRFWQSHYFEKNIRYLNIEFVKDGIKYERFWHAWYGMKTITRLANEFVNEVFEKEGKSDE